MKSSLNRQSGALLIETIIVAVIVAALAAIALPSLSELLLRNDMQNARENIVSSLKMARQIAQSENTLVEVTIENGRVRINPVNTNQARDRALPSRVSISDVSQNDSVSLVFRPVGTAAQISNGQVIDMDSDLHIVLSPNDEQTNVDSETIRVGNYGNIAGL